MNDTLDVVATIGVILFYALIGLAILSLILFPFVLTIGRGINDDFLTFSYKVESVEEWNDIYEKKDKVWNTIWYDEVELLCDLDFQDKEFVDPELPVNGNGHSIKNLSFTVTDNDFRLFNEEVKNIHIENINLTSPNKDLVISVFGKYNCYFDNYMENSLEPMIKEILESKLK